MRLDLHIHSTASDGSCTPVEVVERAARGGLDVIALADHDTTAGVAVAQAAAATHSIEVIPAVEVSSSHELGEIHILGYFVDPEAETLLTHARRGREQREGRMRGMLERLSLQGVTIRYADVAAHMEGEDTAPSRPHLARALVDAGYVASVPDAFSRLIGDEHPAFLPTSISSPREAVETIRAAGGLAIWAHPDNRHLAPLLDMLIEAGLAGLEAYRPGTPPGRVERFERLAERRGLVLTGGSDWHGPTRGRELGDFFVEAREVAPFLDEGGL